MITSNYNCMTFPRGTLESPSAQPRTGTESQSSGAKGTGGERNKTPVVFVVKTCSNTLF